MLTSFRDAWRALLRLPHYFWVGILLSCLLGALYWVSRPAPLPGGIFVAQAELTLADQSTRAGRQVKLPHILDDEDDYWHGQVNYRVTWPMAWNYPPQTDQPLALLLPRVGTRFRVLLNGSELFNVGWYTPRNATINAAWMPYFIPLPTRLLARDAADNRLDIQVEGELLERSGLWPLQIGAYDPIRQRYDTLYWWQVTGTWMMAMTVVLMALMSTFLWLFMRERLFGLMALASVAHSIRLVLSVMIEPPLPFDAYFLVHRIAFTLYCGFLLLFIEDLFGYKLRLSRGLSYAVLAIGPLWMLATLVTREYDLYRIWTGILALTGIIVFVQVMLRTRLGRDMSRDQVLVMMVSVFTLATGIRDFLVVELNFPGDADLRWMSLGSLALMFTLGWVLLQRSTASIREVRHLNATLAKKVAARERELRTAFDQLRHSEQQRAIEHERRRLMRDMHDGLGSQLVQTLNLVRSAPQRLDADSVATMINHALEELRITLDSLEPMDGDLPTILGTLRRRVMPALEGAGIALDWEVEEVPAIATLDSKGVMHLFRCVQEILANVVKHARANRVIVRTWHESSTVYLSVTDNGVGLPADLSPGPTSNGGGRGLKNIRDRAERIGAQVRFIDAEPGVGVEFAFSTAMVWSPSGPGTDWQHSHLP